MTNILPIIEVNELPEEGNFDVCYRVADFDGGYTEYVWNGTRFHALTYDMEVMNTVFNKALKIIADIDNRVTALEGGSENILFEADNISLEELMATIGKTITISSTLTVSDGTVCKITLTDMTVDGEPIEDVTDEIILYGLADWDWQGSDVYSDVFGDGAYFAFGTKPMNAVAQQVTLGFVNENEISHSRTLVIGHIKVEVV